jgi:hypothetical protein
VKPTPSSQTASVTRPSPKVSVTGRLARLGVFQDVVQGLLHDTQQMLLGLGGSGQGAPRTSTRERSGVPGVIVSTSLR